MLNTEINILLSILTIHNNIFPFGTKLDCFYGSQLFNIISEGQAKYILIHSLRIHLEYLPAVALMHKIQLGVVFVRVFFLQLAGDGISLKDIRDADPTLYSSCKQIIEMNLETVDQDILSLTFAYMLKSWDP
ncbi:hypothetical protein MTR67_051271 [Solanum verrucosum]|uniref:HECT-type E3 ubiquitin transferase n=1 Tax=Solanum verrucosum TaxID=315347 RepID=A0AAF0ZZZ7_SOLVR|nr:hypothetical protein MTR67_051271 [Solanum verrucosum]